MLQYKDFLDEEVIQFLGEEYAHLVGELPYNKKKALIRMKWQLLLELI